MLRPISARRQTAHRLFFTSHQSPVTSHASSISSPATLPPSALREVRDHEPHAALFGGEEGYELYAALIAQAAEHLAPGGILVLELGHNSVAAVQPLLDASAWINVGVTNDLAGMTRVIAAERL